MGNITKIRQLNDKEVTEEVYSKFFATSEGFKDVDIVCNNKNTSGKMTSFSFNSGIPTLRSCFGIPDSETNDDGKVFDEVCRNLGLEKNRILTLDSSALLVLLVFYKVNKNNPIVIEGVEYNEVLFEVKNKVFSGGPSLVDVLLVSSEKNDSKTLLFLESKFTEPLTLGGNNRSLNYEKYYLKLKPFLIKKGDPNNNSVLEYSVGLKKDKNGKDLITITGVNGSKRYCEGVTQMIAHFIGLCKGPSSGEGNDKYRKIFKGAKNLILGEILFDFPDEQDYDEMRTMINDYKTLYEGLAKVLKKDEFLEVENIKNDKDIVVLENALTYQRVLEENPVYKEKLDVRVRDFYHF